jgi:nitrate/nitrite transporter NarK
MRTRKEISPTVEFSNLAASWDSILSGFAVWFIVPEIIGIVINLLQNSLYKAETTHITYISVGLKRCSAMRKICVQLILSKHSTG